MKGPINHESYEDSEHNSLWRLDATLVSSFVFSDHTINLPTPPPSPPATMLLRLQYTDVRHYHFTVTKYCCRALSLF